MNDKNTYPPINSSDDPFARMAEDLRKGASLTDSKTVDQGITRDGKLNGFDASFVAGIERPPEEKITGELAALAVKEAERDSVPSVASADHQK